MPSHALGHCLVVRQQRTRVLLDLKQAGDQRELVCPNNIGSLFLVHPLSEPAGKALAVELFVDVHERARGHAQGLLKGDDLLWSWPELAVLNVADPAVRVPERVGQALLCLPGRVAEGTHHATQRDQCRAAKFPHILPFAALDAI